MYDIIMYGIYFMRNMTLAQSTSTKLVVIGDHSISFCLLYCVDVFTPTKDNDYQHFLRLFVVASSKSFECYLSHLSANIVYIYSYSNIVILACDLQLRFKYS